MSAGRARMIRARVEVEFQNEDGTRYEMDFDITPASGEATSTYELEHYWEEPWDLTTHVEQRMKYSDMEFRFEEVHYEGLIQTINPDEVDNP